MESSRPLRPRDKKMKLKSDLRKSMTATSTSESRQQRRARNVLLTSAEVGADMHAVATSYVELGSTNTNTSTSALHSGAVDEGGSIMAENTGPITLMRSSLSPQQTVHESWTKMPSEISLGSMSTDGLTEGQWSSFYFGTSSGRGCGVEKHDNR